MSRSIKRINKTKVRGRLKGVYWALIRSRQKEDLREGKDITSPMTIVNDCDYTDYVSNCERTNDCPCMRMFGRKRCLNK